MATTLLSTAGGDRQGSAGAPVQGSSQGSSRDADEPAIGAERAVAALVAGVAGLLASGPISDNSLLTHIATGRLQVSGGLPSANPFLLGGGDFPVPSWWWSASLGWADRLAGGAAVRLFAVAVAAAFGWMLVRSARPWRAVTTSASGSSPSPLAQGVGASLVLLVCFPWLNARPHLGGFCLLAAALWVWRERLSPWWLLGVFALWVNIHGSWVYGVAVLVLSWVGEVLDDRHLRVDRLRWVASAGAGLFLGALAYPEPLRLLGLPAEQAGDPLARSVLRAYHEWSPPSLSSPLTWLFALLVLVCTYGVLTRSGGRGIRFGSILVVAAATLMGASALRLMPIAAVTLGSFAAGGVELAWSDRGRRPVPPGGRRAHRWHTAIVAVGVALLAAAVLRVALGADTDLSRYPVQEVEWLAERDLVASEGVTVIHNDWVGNYMEYRFGESARAWVDDRPSVERMVDYVTLRGMSEGWRAALGRADPDVVLWQAEDPLPHELAEDPEWVTALTTDRFLVLCHARVAERC